jgi:transposase-like protein
MGRETAESWRVVVDDLVARGLTRPELLIVDGGKGLDAAISALWSDVPVQRRTVHKLRNLLSHAPERLREEITSDYNDMIYAPTAEEIQRKRRAFLIKWSERHPPVADSLREAGDQLFTFTRSPTILLQERSDDECNRTPA